MIDAVYPCASVRRLELVPRLSARKMRRSERIAAKEVAKEAYLLDRIQHSSTRTSCILLRVQGTGDPYHVHTVSESN